MARILVVEDDDTIGTAVARSLTLRGHEVVRAQDGGSAIRETARAPFALVLLDLGIPDLDGLAVCRELRPSLLDAVIVTLTARDTDPDTRTWSSTRVAEHHLAVSDVLSPALRVVIADHVSCAAPVVLEGDHLTPEPAAGFGADVRAVVLDEPDVDRIAANIARARGRGARALSDALGGRTGTRRLRVARPARPRGRPVVGLRRLRLRRRASGARRHPAACGRRPPCRARA